MGVKRGILHQAKNKDLKSECSEKYLDVRGIKWQEGEKTA
jgi:hypothetical protein